MKSPIALLVTLPLLSLHAQASDSSLQLGDLAITRGMSLTTLRAAMSSSYELTCSDAVPGIDVVHCVLSTKDGSGSHLDLRVKDDKILTVSQGYSVSTHSYDALLAIQMLLMQLTNAKDTCAVVRVSAGPPPQFSIALPEKVIAVFLHEPRYEQRQGQVTMNVGLRQNPTPNIQLEDCWPTIESAEKAPPSNAMQRSALVVTPRAQTANGNQEVLSASGTPTAHRR
jgi:hypothetical protein